MSEWIFYYFVVSWDYFKIWASSKIQNIQAMMWWLTSWSAKCQVHNFLNFWSENNWVDSRESQPTCSFFHSVSILWIFLPYQSLMPEKCNDCNKVITSSKAIELVLETEIWFQHHTLSDNLNQLPAHRRLIASLTRATNNLDKLFWIKGKFVGEYPDGTFFLWI